jgi:hypothetical protein
MTNIQLLVAIGVPLAFNGLMFALVNKRIDDMRDDIRQLRTILTIRSRRLGNDLG